MNIRWRGMRYTKTALAMFGAGLVLGFVVVVVGGDPRLERVASALMALGLAGLPLALFADGRGIALIAWIAARLSGRGRKKKKTRPRSRQTPARRGKPPTTTPSSSRPRTAAARPRRPSRPRHTRG